MKQLKIQSLKIITGCFVLLTLLACSKDKTGQKNIDQELYDNANSLEGFVWFKNTDQYLPKSSGSGHNYPKLRTRFNAVAAQMLDVDGKVITGVSFADGSLIVKELINDDNSLARYAILFKDSDNKFADAQGWVWGYINSDQSIAVSAEDKGAACISCHQVKCGGPIPKIKKLYIGEIPNTIE